MEHRYNHGTTSVPVSSLVSSAQPRGDSSADSPFREESTRPHQGPRLRPSTDFASSGELSSPPSINFGRHDDSRPTETSSNTATLNARVELIDDFFIKHGAHRPPAPCTYCKRLRLQCLILRTTSANPNPIESCSSCVALYRDCSLAERSKREAQSYETPLPVIGHLHGVAEEGVAEETGAHQNAGVDRRGDYNAVNNRHDQVPSPFECHEERQDVQYQAEPQIAMGVDMSSMGQQPPVLSRRNSSDSIKRIRVLRNWFAGHWKHPYPDEQEKAALVEQSGLTKTQVVNWFANARRRQRAMAQSHVDAGGKVFAQGSPMPESSLSGMSPMERWRNSPPSDDHISPAELEGVMDVSGFCSSETTPNGFSDRGNVSDGAHSSVSGESNFYHPAAAPAEWPASASSAMSLYTPEDAGRHDLVHVGHGPSHGPSPGQLNIPAPMQRDDRIFRCTFCHQSFKKKYDWVRHERSIHLPGLDTWICAMPLTEAQSSLVWRVGNDHPECIFCGEPSPTEEHIQSHEFQACAERPLSERTFTRKDHLWQHLHKFHQCRKWEGWKPNLQLLQRARDEVESECGFCKFRMRTWSERADHLGRHFRNGASMADWVGGPGIKDVKYEGLLGWD